MVPTMYRSFVAFVHGREHAVGCVQCLEFLYAKFFFSFQFLFVQLNRNQSSYDDKGNLVEAKCKGVVQATDLIQYGGRKYELSSVIFHIGSKVTTGHYVTYNVKDMSMFNDSPVPKIRHVTDYAITPAIAFA